LQTIVQVFEHDDCFAKLREVFAELSMATALWLKKREVSLIESNVD
jgi:hypothetical protein